MKLKSLILFGFKSFAEKTTFDFTEGMTAIVGPNGCGKSNVVDAMRWILGEQRPTSMRGKEMTDVIFKGCASRPSMGVAEGTIVLDNSMGTVETHGAEISVTRRVYKSGEGEYCIDGQKVRLKDVKEMLFDTGLGSRGYSVLEQGRIDVDPEHGLQRLPSVPDLGEELVLTSLAGDLEGLAQIVLLERRFEAALVATQLLVEQRPADLDGLVTLFLYNFFLTRLRIAMVMTFQTGLRCVNSSVVMVDIVFVIGFRIVGASFF